MFLVENFCFGEEKISSKPSLDDIERFGVISDRQREPPFFPSIAQNFLPPRVEFLERKPCVLALLILLG